MGVIISILKVHPLNKSIIKTFSLRFYRSRFSLRSLCVLPTAFCECATSMNFFHNYGRYVKFVLLNTAKFPKNILYFAFDRLTNILSRYTQRDIQRKDSVFFRYRFSCKALLPGYWLFICQTRKPTSCQLWKSVLSMLGRNWRI